MVIIFLQKIPEKILDDNYVNYQKFKIFYSQFI